MSTTIRKLSGAVAYEVTSRALARRAAVPWYLFAVALAATFVVAGIIWDISWHMTIGRDTFWTPAHMCTYAAGAIVGITCGWIALRTTFAGSEEDRATSVGYWGFRAPLGAWICVWGSFAMLTSAPFDDWWHNAYGLDVKIQSPPHTLLLMGMAAIVVGALVWTVAWQNRADDRALGRKLEWLYVYEAGLLLSMVAVFLTENTGRGYMHASSFYRASSIAYPLVLVAVARGSTMRWPATTTALVYMGVRILAGWILPLFPAEPKLGPIYNHVTHMVAMEFPILLVAPGIAIDLLVQRLGKTGTTGRDWATAPLYALAFVAVLLVVQWPFADFLHSPAARNWMFFTDRNFTYGQTATGPYRNYRYFDWGADRTLAQFGRGFALALLYATLSTRLGMAWGKWMRGVRR